MKKLNKKGFTLAELLIVIAIIAVLIAIAIPTFSGALRNAKLQTDHANIRSAYAMVMTANMMGGLDVNGDGTMDVKLDDATTPTYYFMKDGTLGLSTATDADKNAYKLQVTATADPECTASAGCKTTSKYVATGTAHNEGLKIQVIVGTNASGEKEFQLKLN